MSVCALWLCVSSQASLGRLARQTLSRGRPRPSAGAQVGTVSATTSPLLIASDCASGNWTACPKYGVNGCTGLWAVTRPKRRSPCLSTVMPAWAGPPRFCSKYLRTLGLGVPRVIDQATILPALGATNRSRLAATRTWNAVVREITSHGLVGQLGGSSAPMSPTSMILAEAAPGRTSSAATAAKRSRMDVPCMTGFNTSDRSRLLSRRRRRRSAAPAARQALLSVLLVVGDLRSLGQRAVAVADDPREMDEQVSAALIGRDEAESLVVGEPLDRP